MKRSLFFAGLALIGLWSCQSVPEEHDDATSNIYADSTIRQIRQLGINRDAKGLLPYLESGNRDHQLEAVHCLGSFMDESIWSALSDLIGNGDKALRLAAAFSLGQCGLGNVQWVFYNALKKEKDIEVRAALLEALGKCADSSVKDSLYAWPATEPIEIEGKLWGLYRYGLKGFEEELDGQYFFDHLDHPADEVRIAASACLSRFHRKISALPVNKVLSVYANESRNEVKMNLIRALSGNQEDQVVLFLLDVINNDPNPLCRVNATRAMGTNKEAPVMVSMQTALFNDSSTQVQVAAAQYFAINGSLEMADTVWNWSLEHDHYRVRSILREVAIKNGDPNAPYIDLIKEAYMTAPTYEKALLLKALASLEREWPFVFSEAMNTPVPVIRTTGLGGLLDALANRHAITPVDSFTFDVLRQSLASGDVGLISLAASFIRKEYIQWPTSSAEMYEDMKAAAKNLELPREVEAMVELLGSISHVSGTEIRTPDYPKNLSVNWEALSGIPVGQQVIISTAKGAVTVELFVEEAPVSTWNFLQLIESGFYSHQYIHRVVPNFVAQDGCPRGDGYGGPDHLIPSEFTSRRYEAGSLGMASAGPDTESSQWFITHSPTPHLEGRYTQFGRVTTGMDVVQRLEVGDAILGYEIVK